MSERLSTEHGERRRIPQIDVFLRQKYPALEALDLLVDNFGQSSYFYRITPILGSELLRPGRAMYSRWTDRYEDENDNLFGWEVNPHPLPPGETLDAFIECVGGIQDKNGPPILHLLHHITDVEYHSSAIGIDKIHRIERYSPFASELMIMYQNAEVDGSADFYKRLGQPISVNFAELDAIIKHLPEPEEIYIRT